MMNKIICDLDGTLANITHRLHFLDGNKKDWDAFFNSCDMDSPIYPTVDIVKRLTSLSAAKVLLHITSGRSEVVRDKTVKWLLDNHIFFDALTMRKDGDHRPDWAVKQEWLLSGMLGPKENIMCVFDDRKSVVDMWRRNGLTCYQVAEGEF